MPNWLLKSAIQRTISFLPCESKWNEIFQRLVTKSLDLGEGMFQAQVERAQRHVELLVGSQKEKPGDFTAFEIGTGWYPTIPMGLYLCGSSSVWTFDIVRLLTQSRIQRMVELFCEYDDKKTLQRYLPFLRQERMDFLRESAPFVLKESPEQFLARFKIYANVRDALHSGLPSGSIDISFSHAVLQHIPPEGLKELMAEFRRLSSAQGTTSHWINLSDLYANSDRSISPFNCLQFSDRRWRYLDSPLAPQNRLRISDYREIFTGAGFKILKESNTSGSPNDLKRIRLAPRFQKYSMEDLLVLGSWLVGAPA
jgi:hypothetical protein